VREREREREKREREREREAYLIMKGPGGRQEIFSILLLFKIENTRKSDVCDFSCLRSKLKTQEKLMFVIFHASEPELQ
jgi:hypothetical protein